MQTATEAWIKSMADVLTNGNSVSPRGIKTTEILNQQITFDMNYPICHSSERKLSYGFMAAEAYWITSGSPFVEDITPYNKHIAKYSDDGYIFNGAYGPAFLSQVNFVVNTLYNDPNSRQAIMTIWHPNPIDTKDHKCTIALMFNIRNNRLNTTVIMRSNDLFLGRPYDMFNFTIMTLRILTSLNKLLIKKNITTCGLGEQTLIAMSSHIYESNKNQIKDIILGLKFDTAWTSSISIEAIIDWQFVVDSLLDCRAGLETNKWRIRP